MNTKNNPLLNLLIIVIFLFSVLGCAKDPESIPTADPNGTITININSTADEYPASIYYDMADFGPVANRSDIRYAVLFGMKKATTNFSFYTYYNNPPGTGGFVQLLGDNNCWIADVGKKGGLGDVIEKPTSGWTKSAAVIPGNGYVIRIKKSGELNSTMPYYYGRVYVKQFINSTSGGIIGATIKYQFDF